MSLAYLVNTYPRVSHSFIRREIIALEKLGFDVRRYSIRRSDTPQADEADRLELEKTKVVLGAGPARLAWATLAVAATAPIRFIRGLREAWRMGRRSNRGAWRHLFYLAEAAWLKRAMSREGCTHVHAHFGTNSTAVAWLCNLLGGPGFSFTVHGPEEFDRPEMLSLAGKIRAARFVVAISQFGRSQLCRWCDPTEWSKLHVVHCGVDDQFLRAPVVPVPGALRLVCVGRLCEQKGQLVLLDAAANLKRDGVDFELVFAGDGELRQPIEKRIDELGLRSCVRITGWIGGEGVKRELLAARAMVLPSFAEGLPVVIMEALALHRPVISTFVAGIPELLVDGLNGWLVPAGSTERLTAAMREAITASPETLACMGRAGAKRVAADHEVMTEAMKLAELFAGVDAEIRNPAASGSYSEGRLTSGGVERAPSMSAPRAFTPALSQPRNAEGRL